MKVLPAFLLPLLAEAAIFAKHAEPGYGMPSIIPKAMKPISVTKSTPKLSPDAIKETLVYGPFKLKANNATHAAPMGIQKIDKTSDVLNLVLKDMCKDCVILSAHPQIVLKNNTPAEIGSGLYVHHILMNDLGRMQIPSPVGVTCGAMKSSNACISGKPVSALAKFLPKMSVFIANGADGGEVLFTPKDRSVQSGFYMGQRDKMLGSAEIVNYDSFEKDVYFSLDYEYLPHRPKDTRDVSLSALDISGCFQLPLDIPKTNQTTFESPEFTVIDNGYIVSLTPHLHDGGVGVKIFKNDEVVCDSQALYGGSNGKTLIDGQSWETITDYTPCKMPIKLTCGDKLKLKANYDVTKHRLRPMSMNHDKTAEAMALASISVKIPSSPPARRPAHISRQAEQESSLLRHSSDHRSRHSDNDDEDDLNLDDELSAWSDTGDLGDQLADEDPLQIRLEAELEKKHLAGPSRKASRKVRVSSPEEFELQDSRVFKKKDIAIPAARPRGQRLPDRILIAIMRLFGSQLKELHGKPLIYFTSIFVSLGVFLFGYDQGVMSGIITNAFFRDYFDHPSAAKIGTVVAILEVGAFVSSLCVGRLGDIYGRRKTVFYGSAIFVVGGALQTFSTGLGTIIAGRVIAGLGVGALSTIVPVYQSEISPPHNRGKLACIEFTGNIIGYASSVWVDYFCSYIHSDMAWRLPLFMQCVMGLMLALGSFLLPESPRWLLDNDHDEEGILVIASLYGGGDIHNEHAREEFRTIKMDVLLQRQEGEKTYSEMWRRYKKRVLIAMSSQAFAQLNGINVISYYAPLVFEQAGWHGREAILMTGINGITYVLASIPPWYLVDRWGRRPILMSGAIIMVISLSAISYFIYIDIKLTPRLVVIFVMIYNAFFGYSWGPIPWLYPPEILPLTIRAKGASLSTATNWAFNWLVGELTPILQETIKWRLYLVHAFFCACSCVAVYFFYPETRGIKLEDMTRLFGDATTTMNTPATIGGRDFSSGAVTPVPYLDLRGEGGPSSSAQSVNIEPPVIKQNGNGRHTTDGDGEGAGAWISRMLNRLGGDKKDTGGEYRRVDQGGDDDEDA